MRYSDETSSGLVEELGALVRQAQVRRRMGALAPHELASGALALALGSDPGLVTQLSPRALASMLELSSPDDRVISLLAEALDVEAEVTLAHGGIIESRLFAEQARAVRALLDPSRGN